MAFEDAGFIDSSIQLWISKFHQNHSDLFSIAEKTNELCQKNMYVIDAHNKDPQELVIACLYIRILSNFQSIIILCERGMMPEARIILRAMYEAVFILGAIINDESLVLNYVNEHELDRLKILNS
jgi:hypothetical protein